VTRKTRPPRAVMDSAAKRLLKLRVEEESDAKLLAQAVIDLGKVEQAIVIIKAVYDSMGNRAMEIRQAETMAGGEAWRLISEYDEPFIRDFVGRVDLMVLRVALQGLDEARLNELRGVFCDAAE